MSENFKDRPTAFVGSSSESKDIAGAIHQNLEANVEITCWYHLSFSRPMSSIIEDLNAKAARFDFGVFIFTPDDVVTIREKTMASVRNNVLFELGFFGGRLGLDRVFVIAPSDFDEAWLPTDLQGRNIIKFSRRQDGDLHAALETACITLQRSIVFAGARPERLRQQAGRERNERAKDTVQDLSPPDRIIAEKQIGASSFVVINDDIRNARTDIIVSSDDNHFTSWDGVSKAIVDKARVRSQLEQYARQQFHQGQIVVTTGGEWNCRAIIHAAVIDRGESRYPNPLVIRDITQRVLDCAVALGGRSIALPVLGGGFASQFLRPTDSVHAMASTIRSYLSERQHVADGLRRVALYLYDRADAAGLPKELMQDDDQVL